MTTVGGGYSTRADSRAVHAPQDDDAAALAVAEAHEAVVQVVLVGGRGARAAGQRGARSTSAVSRIGTPRMTSGMNSGAKKKYVCPLNARRCRAPADDHRRRRHQQAEQQRAAVAHEDLGRVEVVRQEADAHAQRR